MGEGTCPGRQGRWVVAGSPRAHRAPAPKLHPHHRTRCPVPQRDQLSLLQRVLPVPRLEQPGFSLLLFTCRARGVKPSVHSPQPGGCQPCSSARPGPACHTPLSPPPPAVSGLSSPCPAYWGHSWLQAPALRRVDPEGCLLCGLRDSEGPSTVPNVFPLPAEVASLIFRV